MTLYINACVREESRTATIAKALLDRLGGSYTEVNLSQHPFTPLTRAGLERRNDLLRREDYQAPDFEAARQFASAEVIVIAAPFWDLSFPASLKTYLENIYVTGIVSRYGPDGRPVGLCSARKLYYVTTAGGPYVPTYSYGYLRDMALNYFGIGDTALIFAEMLDVEGFDAQAIVEKTISDIVL